MDATYFCQLWHTLEDNQPYTVKAIIHLIWTSKWNQNDTNIYFNPILISCPVINYNKIPHYVTLTKDPCNIIKSISQLKLINYVENENINNFTICVKNLNFKQNMTNELIQWIEIHRILGANNIFFYTENITKPVDSLLNKYIKQNDKNFKIIRKNAPKQLNKYDNNAYTSIWQRRRDYLVTYNDCFYQNIHNTKYVILVDLDEIIIPNFVKTWNELFDQFLQQFEHKYASFMIQNLYYFLPASQNNNSSHFYLLNKNINRSKYFSPNGESGKSFMSTQYSLTVFNHYTFESLIPGISRTYFVPHEQVQLNHYRYYNNKCPYDITYNECKKYYRYRKRDTILLKYRQQLIDNIEFIQKLFKL